MYQRELLADMARLAYETIKELMIEAVADDKARPGVVAVPQSFGSVLNVHPHTHCLASRGVWDAQGQWIPIPYIDTGSNTLFYGSKSSRDGPLFSHPKGETLDILEFIARVLTQIPKPRTHGVRYFGAYSSRARVYRKKTSLVLQSLGPNTASMSQNEPNLSPKKRAALRKRWAQLIRRVYLTDPLICPDCGGELRVIAFITEARIIEKILRHLANRKDASRAPPAPEPQPAFTS
jgi:hypothetical protein